MHDRERPDEATESSPSDATKDQDNEVDEASEESFPASDPPAY